MLPFKRLIDFAQFNRGWKLALVVKCISPPPLTTTYDKERLPVIQNMLDIVAELNNTMLDITIVRVQSVWTSDLTLDL
ncbi:hypothetical protein EDB19DRAFT_1626239 [Suillus lakei]|nr:hypothetical protein EDB19DRAFT_1626239 [Suillus lakei]